MQTTVRGILENLLGLVEQYGFVPNGGRIYYTRRSQPPFLTLMMHAYYEHSHDVAFVKRHIDTLETEYNFWHRRTVVVQHAKTNVSYGLARYRAESNTPRPEGYTHDLEAASHIRDHSKWRVDGGLVGDGGGGGISFIVVMYRVCCVCYVGLQRFHFFWFLLWFKSHFYISQYTFSLGCSRLLSNFFEIFLYVVYVHVVHVYFACLLKVRTSTCMIIFIYYRCYGCSPCS